MPLFSKVKLRLSNDCLEVRQQLNVDKFIGCRKKIDWFSIVIEKMCAISNVYM